MNKRNKILLLVMLTIAIALCCVIGYMMLNKKSEKENVPDEKEAVSEIVYTGVITSIEDDKLSVNDKHFDISHIQNKEVFYVDDKVSLTYSSANDKNDWIIALSITLVSRDEEKIKIQALIDNMTLEEKVGQMFMVRCPLENAEGILQQYHLGGYILFDENIYPYTREQFVARNAQFQANSKIPMLIGLDEEGGIVNRLSWYTNYRALPFASPQDLYNQGGFDLIKSDTEEKADLLKSVGVNVNFAPVADVSFDAADFIYPRAFGRSVSETSEYVETVVSVMKAKQMGSVLKHFPGYGNNADTHTGSSYDKRALSQFEENDFKPFIAGIKAGADSILVNHNVIESIDDSTPASLSKEVHDILRNDLAFDGVIFTDDLIMEAITNQYGDATSAIMAVQAGNDLLISSNFTVQIEAVINAVKNGEISEERLNQSVQRILTWKYHLGLLN